MSEIRDLVADDDERQRYRKSIVGQSERFMAADTLLKQGEMALFRQEREPAAECFQRMLEIDPGGAGSHERRERARLALLQLEDG